MAGDLSVSTLGGGPISDRNALINSGFQINQRAVTGTVTLTAGQYGHDRWKAGAGGCTYTFATSNNVTTLTITAGTLVQVIEGINLQSGGYVLSWSGTAQGRVDAGSYGASGAVTGTAVGGTNQQVEFSAGTLSKVMYEPGNTPTAWFQRQVGYELALCQRRCVRWSSASRADIAMGLAYGTTLAAFALALPQTMAAAPTLTSSNLFVTNGSGTQIAGIGSSVANFSGQSILVSLTVAAGLTVGQSSILSGGNGAGGWLQLESEL